MSTEDTVCLQRAYLVTEAYQKYENDPVVLKRAKAFAHVLQNMDLDIESNPVFAGNTSSKPRAWMLIPEHGFSNDTQVVIENESLAGILDGKIPEELQNYWKGKSFGGSTGIGHLAVDMNRVVHEGLEAMIDEARDYENEPDPDKRNYRQAMAIALQAVIDWARRYAKAAEEAKKSQDNPLLIECYIRIAEACRQVPAKPARNLFEGLQSMALAHLAIAIEGHGMSVSIGLPDRVLAPFINDDFEPEYVTNLISAFMLKITANSVLGRGSKTQAITVGGVDHQGKDQCNELTLCFLEACNRVRVGDPHLFLRWHKDINQNAKKKAVEMLSSGVSMPLLINDLATAQGFINAGVKPEDAYYYCVIGCNELGIPGRSAESATATSGNIQYLELLNRALLEHPEPDSIQNISQLLELLESNMIQTASNARKWGSQHRKRMIDFVPTPFTSALMRGCIHRGQDMLIGMDYHIPGVYERGLTNAINALMAIQKVVFDEKTYTMGELVNAMKGNFQDKSIKASLLTAHKWGNNDDQVDKLATVLVDMRERVLNKIDEQFGNRQHIVCHVVRSLHHVDGRRIAASPDGRYAWTPVADSIGAQTGTALAGPTAILNSVLKLDAAKNYRGGYNLNLTFSKSNADPDKLLSLIETFFNKGGQELQINCLDASTLRDAIKNPEKYKDLVVRVAGFSTRFVDLSSSEQKELIERAEVAI